MGENASAQAQTRVVELSINFRYLINERPVQCTVRDPAVRGLAVPRMGQSFRESKISFSYRIHDCCVCGISLAQILSKDKL